MSSDLTKIQSSFKSNLKFHSTEKKSELDEIKIYKNLQKIDKNESKPQNIQKWYIRNRLSVLELIEKFGKLYEFTNHTLYAAINFTDKILTNENELNQKNLTLIVIACCLMASKFVENDAFDIDLNEVMAGIQIQLLTYIDAVSKKENANLAGTLYFNLIEPVIKAKNKHLTEEELEQEIRNNFRMNGLILGDVEVVKMMDKKLVTGNSDIIPAYIDKDGNLSNNKPGILKEDEFKLLQNKVEKIIKQISEEILSGKIAQNPVYLSKNKATACDYCSYKAICGFDSKICNNRYNYIPNLKKEEIFNKMLE